MQKGVAVARDLEHNFQAKHFHVNLTATRVTTTFKDLLNTRFENISVKNASDTKVAFYGSTRLVVETVRAAPTPSLFFATMNANKLESERQLEIFAAESIPDASAFAQHLWKEEYPRLKRILQERPQLSLDFQAIIDPQGHLYHIDLDGHLGSVKDAALDKYKITWATNTCLRLLRNAVQTVLARAISDFHNRLDDDDNRSTRKSGDLNEEKLGGDLSSSNRTEMFHLDRPTKKK